MDVMLEDSEKDWDVDPDSEQQKKKRVIESSSHQATTLYAFM